MSMESIYEYGARAGVWRLLDLFKSRGVPLTVFAVAMAAERHPAVIERCLADGHEIASHGYRWINYHGVPVETEREHIAKAMEILTRICGSRPLGWYTGRTSENTRKLVAEHGGFLYDADDYSDDLPFWSKLVDGPHLIVPYTLDANDMRFAARAGLQLRRSVLRLSQGRVRHALRGRREVAQDDVDRPALPAGRAAGTLRQPQALPRLRAQA